MLQVLMWLLLAHVLLALLSVVLILRRRREPMSMLVWIFAVTTVPFVGSALYAMMDSVRVRRRAGRRRRRVAHLQKRLSERAANRRKGLDARRPAALTGDLRAVERIGRSVSQMPATDGNSVRVFDEADETYAALEDSIRAARENVHLQYYIWQADQTGTSFRDLLIEKARQGVECRVLLDAVGCWRLTRRFTRPLVNAGCKLAFFMPLRPFRRRLSMHLRNHRKIAVIDGKTAFVGSQNIGDEYRGRLKRLSPWYDAHMRVRGPAALFLQETFAEDWAFATHESLVDDKYFPEPDYDGDSTVQIIPSGPEHDFSTLGQLLFAAVSTAQTSIRIATPYFVPSAAMRVALVHARYRGVQVQLVLPTRSDSPLVLWAGRSFYPELLDAGVAIYEFDRGMLHSKIVTVDNRWCMIGTANMDVRSFRLNFEVTALLYDQCVTRAVTESIDRHVAVARRVGRREVWNRSFPAQLAEGAARVFAPLL